MKTRHQDTHSHREECRLHKQRHHTDDQGNYIYIIYAAQHKNNKQKKSVNISQRQQKSEAKFSWKGREEEKRQVIRHLAYHTQITASTKTFDTKAMTTRKKKIIHANHEYKFCLNCQSKTANFN